jgi:hypothetical protein
MTTDAAPASLLAELEARQDEVLLRLDELERCVAAVLTEFAALKFPPSRPPKERLQAAA